MLQRHYAPGPPLGHFVELLWLYQGFSTPAHQKERLLPDGSMEMVFNLAEDKIRVYDRENTNRFAAFGGSIVCGPHSKFFVIDTEQQMDVIGIHFRPGGAYPFLKIPSGEMQNLHLGLDALWGPPRAAEVRERLLGAPTPEEKFRILEKALLDAAHGSLERHPAVAFALREFHGAPVGRTIAQVSSQIGLSARRFIDVFQKEVGLTPKLFCRVRRFQRVLRCIQKGQTIDWTQIALECGYYDQAHFIHDFQAFSGINPSAYLAAHTAHLNHVPLVD
jgi:AraC-like DNA-binding protein